MYYKVHGCVWLLIWAGIFSATQIDELLLFSIISCDASTAGLKNQVTLIPLPMTNVEKHMAVSNDNAPQTTNPLWIQVSFPCLFVLKLVLQHTLNHLEATNTINQAEYNRRSSSMSCPYYSPTLPFASKV